MSAPESLAAGLPAGVAIEASRETTQLGANNQSVQGMIFTLSLPRGGETSVFVPYAQMGDLAAVHQMLVDRVNQINSVLGLAH